MNDLAEMVLAGVFPDRVDRLRLLVRLTGDEHWPAELRAVYQMVRRYFVLAGGVVPPSSFAEALEKAGLDPAMVEAQKRVFLKLWQKDPVDDHRWRWALHGLREERQAEAMVDGLTTAMRILTEGVQARQGERLFGFKAARSFLGKRLGEIDRMAQESESVDGNILEEAHVVVDDYRARATKGVHRGVMTGFAALDNLTYGAQRGEFWLIAAYAGEGKTQALTNVAYQAVMDGKNVVFFTLETLREQVRRRFIVRHANHEKFGLVEGIRYSDLKGGKLTPDEEEAFLKVAEDLANWKSNGYGRMEVVWKPRGTTVDELQATADVYGSMWDVDLIVVDYAGLMSSPRGRERQEQLVDILQSLKGMATAHRDGQGVPVISAYQTTRQRRDEARRTGRYTLDSLAETAEAERSADLVMSLLMMEDDARELSAQVLKYRDGAKLSEWILEADFDRSLLRDRGESSGESGGFGGLLS
jgi:hypothetical protein